jgi:DNA phosphorothioation-associated DGQHR protein 1
MSNFPLVLPAIRVSQPLGEFYVVSIDATTLRHVTFLDPTRIDKVDAKAFLYNLLGAQRPSSMRRAKDIAKYIDTTESAFPNSIILAANYIDYGVLQEDEAKRWRVEAVDTEFYRLVIPTEEPMSSVVDGQHRLLGFDYCQPHRKTMELLCAVYMDLPHPYQAYLFATININQRKVDKSLAYEQFGYNLQDEDSSGWAPDKLAVYFARRLNLDPQSPFHGRIRVAPLNSELLFPGGEPPDWQVSTACVVEGTARLISQNPKRDRDLLHQKAMGARSRASLSEDDAPWRAQYLKQLDSEIYEGLVTFFTLAKRYYWDVAVPQSYIRKTIGIQGLFDFLRIWLARSDGRISEGELEPVLEASRRVSFADPVFQASGKGRVRVKNTLLLFGDLLTLDQISAADRDVYLGLLNRYPRRAGD